MYAPCVLNMWAKAGKRTCACSREEYGCSGMHAWACSGLHMSHAVHAGPSGAALDEAAAEEPKLLAFTGTGRRLDGKPAAGGPPCGRQVRHRHQETSAAASTKWVPEDSHSRAC